MVLEIEKKMKTVDKYSHDVMRNIQMKDRNNLKWKIVDVVQFHSDVLK